MRLHTLGRVGTALSSGAKWSWSTSLVCLFPFCLSMPWWLGPLWSFNNQHIPSGLQFLPAFKDQVVNIFGFWGCIVFVATTQLCFVGEVAVDRAYLGWGGMAVSQENRSLQQAQAVVCCPQIRKPNTILPPTSQHMLEQYNMWAFLMLHSLFCLSFSLSDRAGQGVPSLTVWWCRC